MLTKCYYRVTFSNDLVHVMSCNVMSCNVMSCNVSYYNG